jgi:hypothetical protein
MITNKGDIIMKRLLMLFAMLMIVVSCSNPTEQGIVKKNPTFDTGFFEIQNSEVGRSNPTEWGQMNQWRIILDDDYMDIDTPVWVDSMKFTLWWKEDHPEQNIGFWFAAPVHNMTIAENQRFIQYTFPVGWDASVLSCGVFTNLHGTVRLKCEVFIKK